MDRGIWVRGTGTASGPRDECVLTVGAEARGSTAAAAMADAAAAADRMRAALLDAGIGESALASTGVSLSPVYDEYPTVAGFQASLRISARTPGVGAVGDLLAAVVSAGGDAARVHEVAFRHADPAALVSLARERAWADAQARATELAELAGRALGEVLAIDETGGRPPAPVRMAAMAEAAPVGGAPMDAGEGSVDVSLTVGWSLR